MSDVLLPPKAITQAPPRGALVADRNGLKIHLGRTDDLHGALAAAASIGITAMGFDFCFYDDGYATCKTLRRREAGGRNTSKQVENATIDRARDLLEGAIREALQEEFDYDREIRVVVGLRFDAWKSSWVLSGSATAYVILPNLNDVEVRFA